MSLLFNILSRVIITLFPRSKCLLISWLQPLSAVIWNPEKQNLPLFPLFPHLFAMKWWDQIILTFWMLSFKPTFSLCSFTFIKRLCSFSLLSAIRMVSSTYLSLLIFLLEILIPVCASCWWLLDMSTVEEQKQTTRYFILTSSQFTGLWHSLRSKFSCIGSSWVCKGCLVLRPLK